MFHRHVWKIKDQTVQQSPWEQTLEGTHRPRSIEGSGWFFKPVLVHSICTVCGTEKVERI